MARKTYTKDEQNTLAVAAKGGDDRARAQLLDSVEGLVIMIAQEFLWSGLALEDLISEGRVIALAGIERFNEHRPGADFGGMSGYWIRQELRDYVRKNMGAATRTSGQKVNKVARRLRPFLAEAEGRGLSPAQALHDASKHFRMSERDAAAILNLQHYIPIGSGEGEADPDSGYPSGEDEAQATTSKRAFKALMGVLTPEEALLLHESVIEKKSSEKIGLRLGVCREIARRQVVDVKRKLLKEAKRRGLSFDDFL